MISSEAVKIAFAPGFLDLLTVIPQHKIGGPGIRCVTRKNQARSKQDKFWRYYKKTWLTKYKPQDWNVHGIDKPLFSRTNNPLERFNREINAAVSSPHPSLPRFVSAIDSASTRYVQRLENTSKLWSAKRRRRSPESCHLPDDVELSSDEEDADENGEDGETGYDQIKSAPSSQVCGMTSGIGRESSTKGSHSNATRRSGPVMRFWSLSHHSPIISVSEGTRRSEATLTDDELAALVTFKRVTEAVVVLEQPPADKDGFAKRTLKRRKVDAKMVTYVLLSAILPTSNMVGRLFRIACSLLRHERHRLSPMTLEMVLILKVNSSY
ncbi:hypothetical protein PHMEG_0009504 [Phytophthora megakarya]|uniref:Uncharacterized protein n=1 Tax=Phytophthora megakarya TaxID=4795 RepID=A0A225WI41_9STRA|nr:hypothetical protein PHMEG_0009504 [Phytophthora megakarya]